MKLTIVITSLVACLLVAVTWASSSSSSSSENSDTITVADTTPWQASEACKYNPSCWAAYSRFGQDESKNVTLDRLVEMLLPIYNGDEEGQTPHQNGDGRSADCEILYLLSDNDQVDAGEIIHDDSDTSTFEYSVYDEKTLRPIGVYTGVSQTVLLEDEDGNIREDEWDCLGTGIFHLDHSEVTDKFESQIFLTVTCLGPHNNQVIGGTGRYEGVIRGDEEIYESPHHENGSISKLTLCRR